MDTDEVLGQEADQGASVDFTGAILAHTNMGVPVPCSAG